MVIKSGNLNLIAADDGIRGKDYLMIHSGEIAINSKGDGIESAAITINSCTLNLTSADDAFNATKGLTAGGGDANDGSSLVINDGNLNVNATTGDSLNSNGNLTITGGIIVVEGPLYEWHLKLLLDTI